MKVALSLAATVVVAVMLSGPSTGQCWGAKAKTPGGAGRVPTNYGGETGAKHTPNVVKALNIQWTEADWPENAVEGYAAQKTVSLKALVEHANGKKGKKPAVIYIAKDGSDEKAIAKLEKDMFGDDDVAIALRFFHPIRLEAKAIPDEDLRAKYVKAAPAMLFLDADGNQVSELLGRCDSKAILSRLDKVFGAHYAGKLGSVIAKIMDSIQRSERAEDKVADAQKRIEDMQGRLAEKDSDVVRKSLDEERKKLVELEKELAKVEDERTKLFSQPLKEAKEVVKGG